MGNRFSLFRWQDTFSFGLAAFLVTALTVYVTVMGENLTFSVGALFWLVALIFWLIYISLIVYRAKWLRKIAFVTKHGIAVIPNEFSVSKDISLLKTIRTNPYLN